MNDDLKDENSTQNPASQGGFVADYTQSAENQVSEDESAESTPAQVVPSESALDSQPEATQPQNDVSGDSPSAVDPAEASPQEVAPEAQAESVAPVENTGGAQPAVLEIPENTDTPTDISSQQSSSEIIGSVDVSDMDTGSVGVDEEPAEVEDTLESLSGDV